jgi:murein DD-endopeptidase MepM/ murein hydrolase activator NlpD
MIGKLLSGGVGLTFILCLCASLVTFRSCSPFLTSTATYPDDTDPQTATCDNATTIYPDNPFSGWPTAPGNAVNYHYCSAVYYEEFGRTHWGIDINTYRGEPVYATAEGVIAWAYYDHTFGMGRTVKVCHASGWCAVYMHLDGFAVRQGDAVSPGATVGYADSTGFSTGDHLHYQINRPGGHPVNPYYTFP